jgi:hypothetical protein
MYKNIDKKNFRERDIVNWKKITILWCAAVAAYSLCAMEEDPMHTDDTDKRCYIAELPFDLLSLLAEYIIESDAEFIKRAKLKERLNRIPKQYNELCPLKICNLAIQMSNGCWRGSMLAVLKYEHAADCTPVENAQLNIVNVQKNEVCYTKCLEKQEYKGVAISECGDLFATIHKRSNNNVTEAVLTIQDIITKEKQCVIIHNDFAKSHLHNVHIDFNIQATKVIICDEFHPRSLESSPVIMRETIIPITINSTSSVITPLGMYFARNRICKNLAGQLEYYK